MTTRPTARNTPLREESPASCGTSPPSDIAPTGHADGGPFFHPAGNNDNESRSHRINQTEFSSSPVKRADSLMNFAEGILVGAGLALMASEDLLCRADHLLASLQNKDGAYEQHKDEKHVRESESNVFA